jgi:hypothetical protein
MNPAGKRAREALVAPDFQRSMRQLSHLGPDNQLTGAVVGSAGMACQISAA